MPTIETFTPAMIEAYAKAKDFAFLKDPQGDYCIEFAQQAECACRLSVWLSATGEQRDVYWVRVTSDTRIAQRDWGRAVLVCNQWNKERRWPKAYLHYAKKSAEFGDIILEGQLDLETGIHQELFNSYTDTIIGTAFRFWEWAHQEKGF